MSCGGGSTPTAERDDIILCTPAEEPSPGEGACVRVHETPGGSSAPSRTRSMRSTRRTRHEGVSPQSVKPSAQGFRGPNLEPRTAPDVVSQPPEAEPYPEAEARDARGAQRGLELGHAAARGFKKGVTSSGTAAKRSYQDFVLNNLDLEDNCMARSLQRHARNGGPYPKEDCANPLMPQKATNARLETPGQRETKRTPAAATTVGRARPGTPAMPPPAVGAATVTPAFGKAHVTEAGGTGAGFVFASGKKVELGADALEKGRHFWQRVNEEEDAAPRGQVQRGEGGPSTATPAPGKTQTPGAGFVFASGKKVELGADALEKGQQFWQRVNEEQEAVPPEQGRSTVIDHKGAMREPEAAPEACRVCDGPEENAALKMAHSLQGGGSPPVENDVPVNVLSSCDTNNGVVHLSLGADLLKRSDGRVSLSHLQNICDGFVCEDDIQSQQTSVMAKRSQWVVKSKYTSLRVSSTQEFSAQDFLDALKRTFKADIDLDLTLAWVQNHIKWVLWKFVAYTRRFSSVLRSGVLTPEHVLGQLRYRFTQENYMGKRSSLHKILSFQARTAPSKIVLFVSATRLLGDPTMIEVSDGWYSIPAKLDYTLCRHLARNKLFVGLKIAVCGAELVGVGDPCHPLDRPPAACLQLTVNGVRPAPWDSKLGFAGRMNIRMHSIVPGGGIVPATVVVIQAQYPLMVFEKLANGGGRFRSLQNEEKAQIDWDNKRACIAEKVQETFEARLTQPTNEAGFNDIAEEFRKEVLRAHAREGVDERRVSTFLRVRVKSLSQAGRRGDCRTSAVVSIWRPAECVMRKLLPGKIFQVTNLNTNVHQRLNQPLQLQATHNTQWLPANESHSGFSQLVCSYALPMPILVADAMNLENTAEFDFVGVVVHQFYHADRKKYWVFLVDDTSAVAAEDLAGKGMPFLGIQPVMLALEVENECEGLSIVAVAKKGQVLSFNNITRGAMDKKEACLNCCASDTSTCMRVPPNDPPRAQRAAAISEFVSQNAEVLEALEARCMAWGRA